MRKIKKLLAFVLVAGMSISMLAACGRETELKPTDPSAKVPIGGIELPKDETPETPEATETPSDENIVTEVDINGISTVLADLYGDKFLCSMDITAEELEAIWGINPDDVEAFVGKQPMMSAHVDKFLVVKTSNVDAVKTALDNYRQLLVDDTFQYPNNIVKIAASEVVDLGDGYLGFFMLGGYNDELDETAEDYEATAIAYYQEETKKGIDAVKGFLAGEITPKNNYGAEVIDEFENLEVVTPEEEINYPTEDVSANENEASHENDERQTFLDKAKEGTEDIIEN